MRVFFKVIVVRTAVCLVHDKINLYSLLWANGKVGRILRNIFILWNYGAHADLCLCTSLRKFNLNLPFYGEPFLWTSHHIRCPQAYFYLYFNHEHLGKANLYLYL